MKEKRTVKRSGEFGKNPSPQLIDAIEKITKDFYGEGLPTKFVSPFAMLVATVISQRTRDETTVEVASRLLEIAPDPLSLLDLPEEDLIRILRPAGFYRQKAKKLKEIARILLEKYGGRVPDEEAELLSLPGVGRKTASVVLAYAFSKPAIAVDTHVHRIFNRLGLVKTKTPERTEEALKKILPEKLWIPLNHSFVSFGKRVCRPVSPRCEECPLKEFCDFYRNRSKNSQEGN